MWKKLSVALICAVALSACGSTTSGSKSKVRSNYSYSGYNVSGEAEAAADLLSSIDGRTVGFTFDSAALTTSAQKKLRALASQIKTKGYSNVVVEGHCDERGTREYNLALGDRRAVAAKKFLVGLGINSSKITTISFGKERPRDSRHNETSWAKNRRSVLVVN